VEDKSEERSVVGGDETLPVIIEYRALQRSEQFKEEILLTNILHWTPSGEGRRGETCIEVEETCYVHSGIWRRLEDVD
jgi:hypothetical protein